MNYYPYFGGYPYTAAIPAAAKTGIFSKLFGGIKFGTILNGAQQTLNVVNQTLPLIKQAGPVFNNAKSMFKVMNEFKKIDNPVTVSNNVGETSNYTEKNITSSNVATNNPTFFQ